MLPEPVWQAYFMMNESSASLLRALAADDDEGIVHNLGRVEKYRNRLVNRLQEHRPELRIAADERP